MARLASSYKSPNPRLADTYQSIRNRDTDRPIPSRRGNLGDQLLAEQLTERGWSPLLGEGDLHQSLQAFLELVAAGAVTTGVEVDVDLLDLGAAELLVDQLIESPYTVIAVVQLRIAYENRRRRYPIPRLM